MSTIKTLKQLLTLAFENNGTCEANFHIKSEHYVGSAIFTPLSEQLIYILV